MLHNEIEELRTLVLKQGEQIAALEARIAELEQSSKPRTAKTTTDKK